MKILLEIYIFCVIFKSLSGMWTLSLCIAPRLTHMDEGVCIRLPLDVGVYAYLPYGIKTTETIMLC